MSTAHDSTIPNWVGRWTRVEPLADHPKQIGKSPYSAFAIIQLDILILQEDPQQAEGLNKSINNRIENLEKNSAKIRAQIDKGRLSEKKLAKLENKLADNSQKVEMLNQSLSDVKAIGNATETYKLTSPSASDGTQGVVKGADGVIKIEGSSIGLHIHEIRHVGQSIKAGGLRFNKEGKLLNAAKVVNGDYTNVYGNEVNAYQTQYSFDGSSPVGANSLSDINIQSVKQIKDANGNTVYDFEKK